MAKRSSWIAGLSGLLLVAGTGAAIAQQQAGRTPVIVELFTSEGCSSCPPAEDLLRKFDKEQQQQKTGAQIIVLEEHVDYWDGLGWHDRFSSRQYTQRQYGYGDTFKLESVYTPQMVIDGRAQFVGNDESQARRTIAATAREMKFPLSVSVSGINGHTVAGVVTAGTGSGVEANGDLYAALVDPRDVTDVHAGENGGRRLEHAGVVRVLAKVGKVGDLGHGPVAFSIDAPMAAEGMRLVVFAQTPGQGRIIGAGVTDVRGGVKVASR